MAAGVLMLVALCTCSAVLLIRRDRIAESALRSYSVFMGLGFVALGTNLLTLLGRPLAKTGLSDPLSLPSRYMTTGLILWACLVGLVTVIAYKRLAVFRNIILIAPVIVMFAAAPIVIPTMSWWSNFFGFRMQELASDVCHGKTPPSTAALYPDTDKLLKYTERMKERQQGFGAYGWCRD
jgi:hypothetical protein